MFSFCFLQYHLASKFKDITVTLFMKGINSITFTINMACQRFNKMYCISNIYCWILQHCVTGEVRSRTDLVIDQREKKSKEFNNLSNEVGFADVTWLHICLMFKLISSIQNTIGAKRSSKSANPVTFSTHRIGQKSDNLFLENLVHVL